jgi:hypothetical protein
LRESKRYAIAFHEPDFFGIFTKRCAQSTDPYPCWERFRYVGVDPLIGTISMPLGHVLGLNSANLLRSFIGFRKADRHTMATGYAGYAVQRVTIFNKLKVAIPLAKVRRTSVLITVADGVVYGTEKRFSAETG